MTAKKKRYKNNTHKKVAEKTKQNEIQNKQ